MTSRAILLQPLNNLNFPSLDQKHSWLGLDSSSLWSFSSLREPWTGSWTNFSTNDTPDLDHHECSGAKLAQDHLLMETLKEIKLRIDMLTGHLSSNFSEIKGSNGSWTSLEINFNKKLTLLEDFSLEDILRLSFFLAERMEKEVPERAGSVGMRQDKENFSLPQLQLNLHLFTTSGTRKVKKL